MGNPVDPASVPPEIDLRVAYALLGKENDLERSILYSLLGQPKRYSELKPLIGKKRDNNLTVALARLQSEGLIERRTRAREQPVTHVYGISYLGIHVVFALQSIRPLQEHLDAFQKARRHVLAH